MSATDILMAAAGSDELFTYSTFSRIVTGSGTLNPPVGAKAMRVAVIGGGGGGYAYNISSTAHDCCGGGGGGCAATKIVPASAISYSIGSGGAARFDNTLNAASDGTASLATFTGYSLNANGGKGGYRSASGGNGGSASGGDYNYSGGKATWAYFNTGSIAMASGGGGGAGPNGSGGSGFHNNGGTDVAATAGVFSGAGWGSGGGGGGESSPTSYAKSVASGGGGAGSVGGAAIAILSTGSVAVMPSADAGDIFGLTQDPVFVLTNSTGTGYATDGGELGGGGGAASATTGIPAKAGNGGSGGMVVEWFY